MEKELERNIRILYWLGIILSGILIVLGWLGKVYQKSSTSISFKQSDHQSLMEKIHWLLLTKDWLTVLCYIGFFVILILPSIRMIFVGYHFIQKKEYPLAFISMIVYALLLFSFLIN